MKRYIAFIIDIFEELFLWLTAPVSYLLHKNYEFSVLNKPGQPSVIIVERWLYKNVLGGKRIDELRKYNLNVFGFFDQLRSGSFEASADRLNDFIEKNDLKNVVLVGISAGGITSLAYLNKYGWSNVDKFISIGTPFYGTPLILPFSFIPSAGDLLPGSQLLEKFRGNAKNKDRMYCMRAVFDLLVPNKSTVLEGSNEVVIDVIGHNNLHSKHKETYEKIAEIILK